MIPRIALATALGVALAAYAQAQRGQPVSRTGLIVGQVVDAATGKPVGGAIVAIGGVRSAPRILTKADGRYLFRDLPPGNFTITATKSGYAEGALGRRRPGGPAQTLELDADERVGDAVVRLWKLGAIAGTIVDESGEPAVRVGMRAWRRVYVGGQAVLVNAGATFTDDRGIYRFSALMPGEYVVGASARHVTTLVTGAPEGAGSSALQVGDFLYRLDGGIVTPPPPVERLWIYPTLFHPGARDVSHAAIVSLAPGEERLGTDLQVQPVPTVRVSGTLAGSGEPAARLAVRLLSEGRDGMAADQDAFSTTSDDSGAFVFAAVPAGAYTLRATTTARQMAMAMPPEMVWAAVPIHVGTTDIDGIVVPLGPGLRISGTVEFDGTSQPPSPQQMRRIPLLIESATGDGEIESPPRVFVSESGDFTTPGLVAGSYVLRVTDSPPGWMFHSAVFNGRDISTSPLDLNTSGAPGVVIRFTDRWSSIEGSVLSPSRNPDRDALVVMFPADRRLWTGYGTGIRAVRAVRTSRTGRYTMRSVAPGEYLLAAIPDDRADDWQDPAFLATLSAKATRVHVADGEHKMQDLRTRAPQ